MKQNGFQIVTHREVIFNTPYRIWQLMASASLSIYNSLIFNFIIKNKYNKKHIQGAVLRKRKQGEKRHCSPIMERATINGTMMQFSCKQSTPKSLWDVKGNKTKAARLGTSTPRIWQHQALPAPFRQWGFRDGRDGAQRLFGYRHGVWDLTQGFWQGKRDFKKRVGKDRTMATYRSRVVCQLPQHRRKNREL